MSIASTTFLFLFMPAAMGIYFLIPARNELRLRNLFMLLASLLFYAWGEPVYILLLLVLILAVWLLGKMAEGGRRRAGGKWAVALTVMVSVGALLPFKRLGAAFPIGLSFFCFHAISYVVDIYRGQCHSSRNILSTALYLSVFFKMLQGPIMTYREFEPQIEGRSTSWKDVSEGVWRFALGLGKKMIIAGNLAPMVKYIFTSDFGSLPMADAWIGCVGFMVYLYFDFSGYSDMAIGLGRVFGFKVPENFNYPYISTSVAEYWRRWHITLIAWFRDYLYYPILLGPSVRFRKWLLRRNVSNQTAKSMQNFFVPACVWTVTALWHGTNWNYTLWGLLNCVAIVAESHFGVLGNRRVNSLLRWMGVMMFLLLTVPLINTGSLSDAGLYFRALLGGSGALGVSMMTGLHLRKAALFLLMGLVGCFPVLPYLKRRWYPAGRRSLCVVWNVAEVALMLAFVVVALAFVFKSGEVWFLYQQ